MENLGLDIFYELTHYLHPQDFARLRVALPRLNAFFNPTYIIRHILQKSNQTYQDKCFIKLCHDENNVCFELIKTMIALKYRNRYLIEKSIQELIQKPHTADKVLWFLQNTSARYDFRNNTVLCWAVKKNNTEFARKLVNLFNFDLSLGNFKVLDWAVRFFSPSHYNQQEMIDLLIPHRLEYQIKTLFRILTKYNKVVVFDYFEDLFFSLRQEYDEFFLFEIVNIAILNKSSEMCRIIVNYFVTNLYERVVTDEDNAMFKTWLNNCIENNNVNCFEYIFLNLSSLELGIEGEEKRTELFTHCLSQAVVLNCYSIFIFLIENDIEFHCRREIIFAYFIAIEKNSEEFFNTLVSEFPLISDQHAQWLLFYCIRVQKLDFFKKLVEIGICPIPLLKDDIECSSLNLFRFSSQSSIDNRDLPPPMMNVEDEEVRPFIFGTNIPVENKNCLLRIEGKKIYVVYCTEYIFSCCLERYFICAEKTIKTPLPCSRLNHEFHLKQIYGKNCRKMHVYLQGVLGLTMKKEWQHFLEWLEGEAEFHNSCTHANCINRNCFLEKRFNLNYPMGVENVYHPEQEFLHLK